jgi:hypothetical protein
MQSYSSFISAMPESTRVWVYQCNRDFSNDELEQLNSKIKSFCLNWKAHGNSLDATYNVIFNRFIVLAVNEQNETASGCSIDSSVRFIKELEKEFNVDFFDRLKVCYIDKNNQLKSFNFHHLFPLLNANEINLETPVFNNMVTTKSEFVGNWLTPLRESWIAPFIKAGV